MLWTEFMSADGYMHNPVWVVKHLLQTDYESELIAQIFWWNVETLVACAQSLDQHYSFGWIELNMWCPSPKIMKCEAWSGMLKNKEKTLQILKQIAQSITTPFSLKTRAWLTEADKEEQFAFLVEASKYVWMIGVHWRTYKQSHSGEVDRPFIYKLKQACSDTVIIWNWWIRTYQDCADRIGPLDGVMIAQAAIGNPRVLVETTPSVEERFAVIFRHLALAMAQEQYFKERALSTEKTGHTILIQPTLHQLENRADHIHAHPEKYDGYYTPREFRKYLFNYISGLEYNKEIKKRIPAAKEYAELRVLLEEFYGLITKSVS